MERNVEKSTGQTSPSGTTPSQVLQYITSIYNHWIYNDYGIHVITDMILDLAKNTKYFSMCKNKNPADPSSFTWRIIEHADAYQFEFKGSALLYRESGCASNMITTPLNLAISAQWFTNEILIPVVEFITGQLNRYRPKLNSENGTRIYYSLLRGFLNSKIQAFPDVASKKFELIIKK